MSGLSLQRVVNTVNGDRGLLRGFNLRESFGAYISVGTFSRIVFRMNSRQHTERNRRIETRIQQKQKTVVYRNDRRLHHVQRRAHRD